jgi:leucyl-tRNA synthetase
MIDKKHLPIVLPEVEKYLPTEDGQPPLGNSIKWAWDSVQCSVVSNQLIDNVNVFPLELNTMPGWAGSSWYWMRYMDAQNENEFASEEALKYWESVDLYIGGSEHATGHLLYARFWNKFLKDTGYAPTEEPFKKLINQGMILGMSAFVYRMYSIPMIGKSVTENITDNTVRDYHSYICVSKNISTKILNKELSNEEYKNISELLINEINIKNDNLPVGEMKYSNQLSNVGVLPYHVDLSCINDITNELNIEKFKAHPLYTDYKDAKFILDNGEVYDANSSLSGRQGGAYIVGREVEKMSKSKYNVVSPDDICEEYGADTLRLYEMFLGPLEQSKPWNTAGITGVSGFLKKLWRLYFDDNGSVIVNDEPTADMYKSLHKTIKKVTEDIENFSFNTSVSQFMICVNELQQLKCNHRAILEPLALLVSPYAPHIAEELWSALGHEGSIATVAFPKFEEKYLVESEKEYPVSFNGKMRFTIKLPLDLTAAQIEEIVMADLRTQAQLKGRTPNKVIIVPGKIINLVG